MVSLHLGSIESSEQATYALNTVSYIERTEGTVRIAGVCSRIATDASPPV
jgi:hypothetical protein